jgi:hypothetical protein
MVGGHPIVQIRLAPVWPDYPRHTPMDAKRLQPRTANEYYKTGSEFWLGYWPRLWPSVWVVFHFQDWPVTWMNCFSCQYQCMHLLYHPTYAVPFASLGPYLIGRVELCGTVMHTQYSNQVCHVTCPVKCRSAQPLDQGHLGTTRDRIWWKQIHISDVAIRIGLFSYYTCMECVYIAIYWYVKDLNKYGYTSHHKFAMYTVVIHIFEYFGFYYILQHHHRVSIAIFGFPQFPIRQKQTIMEISSITSTSVSGNRDVTCAHCIWLDQLFKLLIAITTIMQTTP